MIDKSIEHHFELIDKQTQNLPFVTPRWQRYRQTAVPICYSDLDSANIANSKFIAKSSDDVATSALIDKIVLEVN